MHTQRYTGLADDDRRIARELQAMGAFDGAAEEPRSALSPLLESLSDLVTWMRWKGEVSVYGCRIGAAYARAQEAKTYA